MHYRYDSELKIHTLKYKYFVAGPVTLEDILAVLPFSNTVAIVKLRGLHLLEVLEHSVSALPLAGRFLQFSG